MADSGSSAASFLDIPVGAGPAALGGSYVALANDAYAPTYNPAGLSFLPSTQLSGMHLSYLQSIDYEYASFVHPLHSSSSDNSSDGLGASIQYLTTGDIPATDHFGSSTGEFTARYAAYNLSYGHLLRNDLGLGVTGKIISSNIDSVSGNAYGADIGTLYRIQSRWTAAATVANVGTHMKSLKDSEPLPTAFHLGTAFLPSNQWLVTMEGILPTHEKANLRGGLQWQPAGPIQIRVGYRTDAVKGIPGLTGLSAGMGFQLWGQELSYAWLPYGDLGDTHYFSFLFHFQDGTAAKVDSTGRQP